MYAQLSGGALPLGSSPPKEFLFIHVNDGVSDAQFKGLVRGIKSYLGQETVTDIRTILATGQMTQLLITAVLLLVTLLIMLVGFFSLSASMYTNVMEQRRVIGIQRAIGVRRTLIYRAYLYEAIILTMTAQCFG